MTKNLIKTWCPVAAIVLSVLTANAQNEKVAGENALYVPNTILNAGQEQELSINLKNSSEVTAFQFDIKFPAGITVNTIMNDDDETVPDIQLTERKKSKHQLSCCEQADGYYRIAVISMVNQSFHNNDGPIVKLNVTASTTMSSGEYELTLSNIHIVPLVNGTQGIRIDQPDVTHSICVDNQGGGDAPSGANTITVEPLSIRPGDTGVLNIDMTNEDEICSFQFNIKLPEGVSIIKEYNEDDELVESINLTSRKKSSHELSFKQTEDGGYFLIAYSLNNSTFRNNSGAIVSMKVKADAEMSEGNYGVVISNALMVTPDERKIEQEDYSSALIVTSEDGIEDVISDSNIKIRLAGTTVVVEGISNSGRAEVYNVPGQKLSSVNVNGGTINIDCSKYQNQTIIVRTIDNQKNIKAIKFNL